MNVGSIFLDIKTAQLAGIMTLKERLLSSPANSISADVLPMRGASASAAMVWPCFLGVERPHHQNQEASCTVIKLATVMSKIQQAADRYSEVTHAYVEDIAYNNG